MEIGFLHTHVLVVTLFLLLLLFKTILLLANKKQTLDKVRAKFKMADPILGTLMLVTGGYLLSLYGADAPLYLWIKLAVVLVIIPIGIVGFKKESKAMAIVALLLTVAVYGVAEMDGFSTSSEDNLGETVVAEANVTIEINDALMTTGKEVYTAECKKCHGVDGKKGLFKAPDLTQSNLTLAERIAWIKKGKGIMPSYEEQLSEEEITSVAAYIDELK